MLRKVVKYLLLGLLAPVLMLLIYVSLAVILSVVRTNPVPISCEEKSIVYVSTNGVHLDLIIPREYLTDSMELGLELPPKVSYLAFGWGDQEFYINTPTWGDLKTGTALRALFTESASAVHVVWVYGISTDWKPVPLCLVQLHALLAYVEKTFQKDKEGRLYQIPASGYTDHDKFYQAKGNFSCIQTCNNWVNEGLKAAGVPTSIWSPFDKGVLHQLSQRERP